MRVASISCTDITTARTQITQALPFADAIELRLDYLPEINLSAIENLRGDITLPVIFTLRKKSQGGQCDLPEQKRLIILQQLAQLLPNYLDLEFDTAPEFISRLQSDYPTIQRICSYHDFVQTPADLEGLFQQIYRPDFSIFKIATFATNLCDTLRFLIFLQKKVATIQLIGMTMGEYGQVSRILAPVVGSLMAYGSVDATAITAPGQLTVSEMTEIYRVHLLNRDTAIYGLLGYPVDQSPGHLFHNRAFTERNKNAVYVKLKLPPEHLAEAMTLFRQLPFAGFSITIPHKETIVPYLDKLSAEAEIIRVVNTIKAEEEYVGFNTDGIAAVDVLGEMAGIAEKILILGSGGSAKAIAHALLAQGAQITLCNRTLQRAQRFTQNYPSEKATSIDFETLFTLKELAHTVIINTLPADAFATQCADWKIPPIKNAVRVAMDIVLKPLDTLFLQMANAAGYTCIKGDTLFVNQALRQLQIWFPENK